MLTLLTLSITDGVDEEWIGGVAGVATIVIIDDDDGGVCAADDTSS